MSEPLSKRLFAQTGVECEIDQVALDEHNRRYEEQGRVAATSPNATTNEAANQEPMIPGFDELKREPEIRARVIMDLEQELGERAIDFEYSAPGEWYNAKTGERFVETPGTSGGTLYSSVGDVVE